MTNSFIRLGVFAVLSLAGTAVAGLAYFPGTGHWYEAVKVTNGVTWNEAYTNAMDRGGYLCTVTNAAENSFAASLVDASYYSGVSINNDILGPWLGGFRHANQSNWQWITGEPFTYVNWYPGQPDGYGGSEQRLQYYNRLNVGSTWGDHPGDPIPGYSLPRGYIVEFDQPPRLTAVISNEVAFVSWPLAFGKWTLESAPELSTNATWTAVSRNDYSSNAVSVFIVRANPAENRYFRLRW